MNRINSYAVAALTALGLGTVPLAVAHESGVLAGLGSVEFKVSCNDAAQKDISLAMAYYHSFAWQSITPPLNRALQADPNCGMAYWVRALSMLDNPFTWPIPINANVLKEGPEVLDMARKAGLQSQRERDYVDALGALFKDHDKLNHRTRVMALEEAMGKVAQRYPDDKEATIIHSLILSATFDPADQKFTRQLRAAKTLEPIFAAFPNHPGVAHYLIHSYDYPPIAKHGLDAAQRYAKIAPEATHALHMPSHIFTRVGFWRESIEANRASAKAASGQTFDTMHAYDYMVYAHLQLGQDRAAREVIETSKTGKPVDHLGSAYAYAAMSARYAIERGDWKAAAQVPLQPAADQYPWKKYPQAEAINAFGRGIGAAKSGDPQAALKELQRLQALRDDLSSMKLGYWVEQVDIQAEQVRGLALYAAGKQAEGIDVLRKAADREDATQKHAVTPGLLIPAREVLAQTILESGKAAEALVEFEKVIDKEPNRYRTWVGAAQAAQQSGDMKKAAHFSARLVEQTKDADTPRAEIAAAKRLAGM
jgi:tetratricopeptide (TPR) repeat protein